MTTPQWSPASVLQLEPNALGFTCIGHAKTQRRRCRNPVAYDNRKEAANMLLEMSRRDPLQSSQRLDAQLEELASRLLCRRWHQDQAVEMKRQWRRHIAEFQAAETARRAERSRTVERASDSANAGVARTRVASVRREVVISSFTSSVTRESSSLAITSIVIREELGGRENNESDGEEPRQQRNPRPDSSSRQDAPSRETAGNAPPTSPTDEPIPQRTAPPLQESIATREAHQEAVTEAGPSAAVPSASTPAQHPQHADSHAAHHDRRAIEGDCSICCEDLSSGGTTTWCRAQCRQNFHADCIDLWHASQEVDGRVKTCPYW